jgi:hypothetical protein
MAAAGVALLPGTIGASPARDGAWSSIALDTRNYFSIAAAGHRALIAGGWHHDPATRRMLYDDRVDVYDTTTNSWSVAQLSQARTGAGTASAGDLAIFAGGNIPGIPNAAPGTPGAGQQRSDVMDIYDSATDSWSAAQLSFKAWQPTMIPVGTQLVIPAHSLADGSTVNLFDLTTRTLTSATIPGKPSGSVTWATVGDLLLLGVEGRDGFGWDTREPLVLYEAATGTWTPTSAPTPRNYAQGVAVGPLILLIGGQIGSQKTDAVDIFDTRTGEWSTSRLAELRWFQGIRVVGERAVMLGEPYNLVQIFDASTGGWTTSTPPAPIDKIITTVGDQVLFRQAGSAGEIVIYDLATYRWRQVALSVFRDAYAVATIGSRVLFAGGSQPVQYRTPSRQIDVVDIYDAATGSWSTGQLHRGRESAQPLVVNDTVLFVGGVLGCSGCMVGELGVIVDIYNAGAA